MSIFRSMELYHVAFAALTIVEFSPSSVYRQIIGSYKNIQLCQPLQLFNLNRTIIIKLLRAKWKILNNWISLTLSVQFIIFHVFLVWCHIQFYTIQMVKLNVPKYVYWMFCGLWSQYLCSYQWQRFSWLNLLLQQKKNLPFLLFLIGQTIQTMILIFGAVIITMDMCNRFKIIDILKEFTKFDKEVNYWSICSYFSIGTCESNSK